MKVTIDGEVYDFDSNKMLNTEVIALQKVTGLTLKAWNEGLQEGDVYALTGLVWLVYRRNGRIMTFDEVEFDIGSLAVEDPEQDAAQSTEAGPTEPEPVVAETVPS